MHLGMAFQYHRGFGYTKALTGWESEEIGAALLAHMFSEPSFQLCSD